MIYPYTIYLNVFIKDSVFSYSASHRKESLHKHCSQSPVVFVVAAAAACVSVTFDALNDRVIVND